MPYSTVTLSSAGSSPPVVLNWRGGKPTSALVLPSATSSGAFTLQYTMDDLQIVGGTSLATWSNYVSSAIGVAGVVYNSSVVTADGAFFPISTPVAALRIGSTANGAGSLTLKVIQGEGWVLLLSAMGGSILYRIIDGAMHWTNLIA